MIAKAAIGTLVVFLICGGWLYLAWSDGNRSNDWVRVDAEVTNISQEKTTRRRGLSGFVSTVVYQFDGADYESKLPEYKVGKIAIFVNPHDPNEITAEKGATMVTLGRPIIGTVGSGLFAVVLLLIYLSPKEDD